MVSESTQAYVAIPAGIVHHNRQIFEARIAAHEYERDHVYISRAGFNMVELVYLKRTYAERLRDAEHYTLFQLPADLVGFLRDHENLYRAAVRNRSLARKAIASPDMDVILQVSHRLNNIRTAYYINLIETSRSKVEVERMLNDLIFASEFTECALSLQNEIFIQLTHLDQLTPPHMKDLELENVGPDHNINDFGDDVPLPPVLNTTDPINPLQSCCICLSPWTSTHPPFRITICAHTVGKPCLTRWLNSTARNANLCPCCRTALCERRARKPKAAATPPAQDAIMRRLAIAIKQLCLCQQVHGQLFGAEKSESYMETAVEQLNYRLFEEDVGFYLVADWTSRRWGIRRVIWH